MVHDPELKLCFQEGMGGYFINSLKPRSNEGHIKSEVGRVDRDSIEESTCQPEIAVAVAKQVETI